LRLEGRIDDATKIQSNERKRRPEKRPFLGLLIRLVPGEKDKKIKPKGYLTGGKNIGGVGGFNWGGCINSKRKKFIKEIWERGNPEGGNRGAGWLHGLNLGDDEWGVEAFPIRRLKAMAITAGEKKIGQEEP